MALNQSQICLYCYHTFHKVQMTLSSFNRTGQVVVIICDYLGGLSIFGSVIIPTHAQHILRTVVEFRETVELTVVVVYLWLVDPTEGGLSLIGAVEKWLKNLSTKVKVPRSSQVELLCRWTNLILQVCGETRVQERRLCSLTDVLI